MASAKAPHELYSSYIDTGQNQELVHRLWGVVPRTLGEVYQLAVDVKPEVSPEKLERFKKVVKQQHREWGLLTTEVAENIDELDKGIVETGQQPVCLGGAGYITNKITCAWNLCGLEDKYRPVPVFYIADYDGIQNELLNIWVPSNSPKGLLISLPAEKQLEGCPIYELKIPSEKWLKGILDKLMENYRILLKDSDEAVKERGIEHLRHALSIIKSTYYSSENVSEWYTKIVGTIINIEAGLAVPLVSFSMPNARGLFLEGYEYLLRDSIRTRFIQATNEAAELLEINGYRPQIGQRSPDYVPFFLECMNPGCRRRRIELKHRRQEGCTASFVEGKCPSCGQSYNFSFESENPDLSGISEWISPRVDSRQIVVDSVVPVHCHVGGPGETSYHAEVMSGAKALGIVFPIFTRYTRVFYNTPWNESYARKLKEIGYRPLLTEELYKALSIWVEARNQGDASRLAAAHSEIKSCTDATYTRLLEEAGILGERFVRMREELKASADRKKILEEMGKDRKRLDLLNLYLSSAFGRFSPERYGQEVSWSWLDMAVVSGIHDLAGVFMRMYNKHTPMASVFFANT